LDEGKAKLAEAIGAVAAAKGQVESAKLNLEFCTIASPIDGQVGRTQFQIGNLISPDTTVLTSVVSIDPIYAYFNVDEPIFLGIMKKIRAGAMGQAQLHHIPVDMGLADDVDRRFPIHGTIDFLNNQVDKLTGTILVGGSFSNPFDRKKKEPPLLKPGMFARLRVPLGPPRSGVSVNERAIATDQGYKFVYVV